MILRERPLAGRMVGLTIALVLTFGFVIAAFFPFLAVYLDGKGLSESGIGLVIAKRLTELMGGSLQVHSQPGNGSVFTLTLPAPRRDRRRRRRRRRGPPRRSGSGPRYVRRRQKGG